MLILIAPDSFKGTFTAGEIAEFIAQALPSNVTSVILPMADGGEGTAEILGTHFGAARHTVSVTGPLHTSVNATFYLLHEQHRAFLDMASASGITHCPTLHPESATTYGTGELLLHVIETGATEIVFGIGGSATVDGGAGFLMALGAKLLNKYGNPISLGHKGLLDLDSVDLSPVFEKCRDSQVSIVVPTDVRAPLFGEGGAIRMFGAQKGILPLDFDWYEAGLSHFAACVESSLGQSFRDVPGAGAAGGLGFALLASGAKLVSGSAFVANSIGLEAAIQAADVVITGEGKFDAGSLTGKVTGYVISRALEFGKPVVVIAGSVNPRDLGSTRIPKGVKIVPLFDTAPISLEQARRDTLHHIRDSIQHIYESYTRH